jgi:hypothetical protein
LDFLANRKPFGLAARELLRLAALGKVELYTSVLTMATGYYILRGRHKFSEEKVRESFKQLKKYIKVLGSSAENYEDALQADNFPDLEDAIQQFTALGISHEAIIITRNKQDFTASSLRVYTAEEFLALYNE